MLGCRVLCWRYVRYVGGNVRYVGGVWRGRCGSLFSLGVCPSHCSPLLRFLKNGKWSVADSNSMAPARWVNGQWQKVTISKSNPSSAVRFVTAESGPPPPDEPLSGTSEVHPQLEDPGPNAWSSFHSLIFNCACSLFLTSLTDWTRYVLACAEHLLEHPPEDAPPDSMEQVLREIYRRRQIRRMRDLQMAAIRQETRELEALRVRQVNRATWPVVPLEKLLGLS